MLPLKIVFIMIWTYWLSFCQKETQPSGKAVRSNILALFTLIQVKYIYPSKRYVAPAIHLLLNRYSQATAHYSPIIHLKLKLSVKLHKEAGETLTHSAQLFLNSLIPPRFYCIDHDQYLFGLSSWPPCRPNESGNNLCGTHIPLCWAFRILDAIVWLYVRFNVCLSIIFALIWIIQVAIPYMPIFSYRNGFRCVVFIGFDSMTVNSSYSEDIQYFSLFSKVVLCRYSWWQRRSFWQFKYSSTIMLKKLPGDYEGLIHLWNVSHGCHLLVSSVTSCLWSM